MLILKNRNAERDGLRSQWTAHDIASYRATMVPGSEEPCGRGQSRRHCGTKVVVRSSEILLRPEFPRPSRARQCARDRTAVRISMSYKMPFVIQSTHAIRNSSSAGRSIAKEARGSGPRTRLDSFASCARGLAGSGSELLEAQEGRRHRPW
jgi:hypothetical protein